MIDETLNSSSPESSVVLPTNGTTDIIVNMDAPGEVQLLVRVPGKEWNLVTKRTGSFDIVTPDLALEYMFKGINLEGNANVYFGP